MIRFVWVAILLVGGACSSVPSSKVLERAETHRQLAGVKLAKGDLNYAVREYAKALELHERDAETHFALGETYRRLGRFEDAERHLLRALDLDEDHHDARLNLSVVYLQLERWDDAIRATDVLIENPAFLNPSRGHVNRGLAYFKKGDLERAQADLEAAVRGDGGSYQAHLNLGAVYFERGRTGEAMTSFKRVVELLSRYETPRLGCAESEARFRLAKAYVRLGDRARALEELEQAQTATAGCHWRTEAEQYLAALQ